MTPGDILWLFFVFSVLQPVLKQRFLDASRQRHSRVILLVHRQETMSLLGFPMYRYIDVNDSEEVLRAIHLTDPAVPLDIVLHTLGGLVLAALQIARAIPNPCVASRRSSTSRNPGAMRVFEGTVTKAYGLESLVWSTTG